MRVLALSDIQNDLVAVRKMRAQEIRNAFDAIVVAGDIGGEQEQDIFKILSTFRCPVLYVYGNWDPIVLSLIGNFANVAQFDRRGGIPQSSYALSAKD